MKRRIAIAAIAALLLPVAGCSLELPGASEPDAPDAAPVVTAVVEHRTITDVLTVPMNIVAGTQYTVSASARGELTQDREGRYFFDPTGDALGVQLVPPATSTLVESSVPLDVEVGVGTPLLTIEDSALTVRAELTPPQVLRLADRVPTVVRAQVEGSTGPFDCALNDPRPTEGDGAYFLSCRLPIDIPAVVGSTGLLALTLEEHADIAALPLEAVAGTRDQGLVYVTQDGEAQPVTLGLTDGAYIEITGGLVVGDKVYVPSPSILGG